MIQRALFQRAVVVGSSRNVTAAQRMMRMMSKTTTTTNKPMITRLGTDVNPNMSSAVVYNGILTTMGVIDNTSGGEKTDVEIQTKNILNTIDNLLIEGGTDKSKLLTANIWLKDIESDFSTMNKIWVNWIDPNSKPIRACVESNLAFSNLLVEIQVTAAVVVDDED